ncbi:MAG: DNA helicase RecQ [Mariprofundales bacterium]|nr:DNA helicase RecQ [Mariprofundales bacterium]
MASKTKQRQALKILNETFGYSTFRPMQDEVIFSMLDGRDAFVLMPTGGGKSLCYQIPALLRDGVAIVVSPLIALMRDQVRSLRQQGVSAMVLNSTLDYSEQCRVEHAVQQGACKLLYIAPERLLTPKTLALLSTCRIALFAVDEAHCVSQWGHDFRPEYTRLSLLAEQFPGVPRLALTATADRRTRQDIIKSLAMPDAHSFVAGFDRPNICYRVEQQQNQRQQLLNFITREHAGEAGIVYCLSRKKTESIAEWLQQQGLCALPYHAGMSSSKRQQHQERFLNDEGVIIVATIAFGMGIDKPDVRFVAHLSLPKSIEAYYQETGRAGRDGEPADAWMCYGLQDVVLLRQMMQNSDADEEHRRIEQQKLTYMLGYCELASCRRQALLRYFDESDHPPCGNCDTCLNPVDSWDATIAAQKAISCAYRSGQRFGVGHLIDILLGRETTRIKQWHHNQISTYGVGSELKATEWQSVYRQIIAHGLLEVDEHGALKLHPSSRALLRGEQKLQLRKDIQQQRAAKRGPAYCKQQNSGSGRVENLPLWEDLRALRREIAQQEGVAPFIIFHDSVLKSMINTMPTNLEEMLTVVGIGRVKLERFGQQFLEIILHHSASTQDS